MPKVKGKRKTEIKKVIANVPFESNFTLFYYIFSSLVVKELNSKSSDEILKKKSLEYNMH